MYKSPSEAWPASLFHTQPRSGHLSEVKPVPNLGTLRALPNRPKDPGISLLSLGTLHPSRIMSPDPSRGAQYFRPASLQESGPLFLELDPMLSFPPNAQRSGLERAKRLTLTLSNWSSRILILRRILTF